MTKQARWTDFLDTSGHEGLAEAEHVDGLRKAKVASAILHVLLRFRPLGPMGDAHLLDLPLDGIRVLESGPHIVWRRGGEN